MNDPIQGILVYGFFLLLGLTIVAVLIDIARNGRR